MIGDIYIDGRAGDGRIPVTDSSVLRGDGCFEVLRSYGGKAFRLAEHIDRLELSAGRLEIPLPPRDRLAEWIETSAADIGDGAVRVVVTRGSSVPGIDDPPRVIVFSHPWPRVEDPATLWPVVAPWHAAGAEWDLVGAKTISYAPNLAATRRAAKEGFGDALLITPNQVILEGPTFSVAWVVDGTLETPTLELGILGSITRQVVLEEARAEGIPVVESEWTLDRFEEASEVMALSTIREVQPVIAVGEYQYEPGPVTDRLSEIFAGLVSSG